MTITITIHFYSMITSQHSIFFFFLGKFTKKKKKNPFTISLKLIAKSPSLCALVLVNMSCLNLISEQLYKSIVKYYSLFYSLNWSIMHAFIQ